PHHEPVAEPPATCGPVAPVDEHLAVARGVQRRALERRARPGRDELRSDGCVPAAGDGPHRHHVPPAGGAVTRLQRHQARPVADVVGIAAIRPRRASASSARARREVVSGKSAAVRAAAAVNASVQDCSCERPMYETSPSGAANAHDARTMRWSLQRSRDDAWFPRRSIARASRPDENAWYASGLNGGSDTITTATCSSSVL